MGERIIRQIAPSLKATAPMSRESNQHVNECHRTARTPSPRGFHTHAAVSPLANGTNNKLGNPTTRMAVGEIENSHPPSTNRRASTAFAATIPRKSLCAFIRDCDLGGVAFASL